jgi:hypothetical protein
MRLSKETLDPKRVVFMGDSITDFWKLSESFPGKPYINRGISGQTTPQMPLACILMWFSINLQQW